jgi:hypothetical protein
LSHEPPRTSARGLAGRVYDDPCDGNKSSLGGHFRSRDEPDDILVERSDGKKLKFVVDHKDEVPKDNFPTEAVYGNTAAPQLRLITCGGVDHEAQQLQEQRHRLREPGVVTFGP